MTIYVYIKCISLQICSVHKRSEAPILKLLTMTWIRIETWDWIKIVGILFEQPFTDPSKGQLGTVRRAEIMGQCCKNVNLDNSIIMSLCEISSLRILNDKYWQSCSSFCKTENILIDFTSKII